MDVSGDEGRTPSNEKNVDDEEDKSDFEEAEPDNSDAESNDNVNMFDIASSDHSPYSIDAIDSSQNSEMSISPRNPKIGPKSVTSTYLLVLLCY